jgi:folate-binding protein YgfZ
MTAHVKAGQAIFFDLSGRTRFRVTGADRLRFLNGQTTNDLRKASERSAIEACVLNAKGKIDAHVFISVDGESFSIDAHPALRETLKERLDRYIIADDVQIEDVTDGFSLFHVLSQPPTLEYGRTVSVSRFAQPGWDVWVEATEHDAVLQHLSSKLKRCDSNAAEVMRIEQGIPRWGRELTNEIIPIEANLEQRTIDYQKGCYIGQEVISRIKMSGQTNKRLCGMISLDNVSLQPGMKLNPPSEPGKEAGWITSATHSESIGNEIALGYVKRGFNNVGAELSGITLGTSETSRPIRLKVVSLPFV